MNFETSKSLYVCHCLQEAKNQHLTFYGVVKDVFIIKNFEIRMFNIQYVEK